MSLPIKVLTAVKKKADSGASAILSRASSAKSVSSKDHDSSTKSEKSAAPALARSTSASEVESSKGHREFLKVFVRVRPCLPHESGEHHPHPAVLARDPKYGFDGVFGPEKSTDQVYQAVFGDMIDRCMNGTNVTCFMFGMTSSGKTHTILGHDGCPGFLSYVIDDVAKMRGEFSKKGLLVKCSCLEIYKERVNDLIETSRTDLKVKGLSQRFYVDNISETLVEDPDSAKRMVEMALAARKVGSSKQNKDKSSRSHAVIKFNITSGASSSDYGSVHSAAVVGTLTLVDLAGSERAMEGADAMQEAERIEINRSLSTLNQTLMCLSTGQKAPYRDSVLTKILADALGGNSITTMVCCVSPAEEYIEEAKRTLNYGLSAKKIANLPRINEVTGDNYVKLAEELHEREQLLEKEKQRMEEEKSKLLQDKEEVERAKAEIENLKARIAAAREATSAAASADEGSEAMQEKVRKLEALISDKTKLEEQLKKLDNVASQRAKTIKELKEMNTLLEDRLNQELFLQEKVELLEIQLASSKETSDRLTKEEGELKKTIDDLRNKEKEHVAERELQDELLAQRDKRIAELEQQLVVASRGLSLEEHQRKQKEELLQAEQQKNSELLTLLADQDIKLQMYEGHLLQLADQLKEKDEMCQMFTQEMDNKDNELMELRQQLNRFLDKEAEG